MEQHIERTLLDAYQSLSVTAATAAAIEAHLTSCSACRSDFAVVAAELAVAGEPDHPDRIWAGVVARVDRPRRSLVERGLTGVGVSESTARMLAVTPALRLAWLAAVAVVAGFAVVAARVGHDAPTILLLIAPLLPLAGVATAYGPALDPTHEVGVATPVNGLRLTLLRTVAVLFTTVPVLLAAAIAAPGRGWTPFAWLLPALALVTVTVTLSSWVPVERAGAAVAATWLAAVIAFTIRSHAGGLADDVVFAHLSAQAVVASVGTVAGAVLFLRREQFDLAPGRRGAR